MRTNEENLGELKRIADAMLMGKTVDEDGVMQSFEERDDVENLSELNGRSYEVTIRGMMGYDTKSGLNEYCVSIAGGAMLENPYDDRKIVAFNEDLELVEIATGGYTIDMGYWKTKPDFTSEQMGLVLDGVVEQLYVDIPELAPEATASPA